LVVSIATYGDAFPTEHSVVAGVDGEAEVFEGECLAVDDDAGEVGKAKGVVGFVGVESPWSTRTCPL
jgi:hypothetical protein